MYAGSNPVLTSQQNNCFVSAIGAAVARFPDTEEVTGSIPVSRTKENIADAFFSIRPFVDGIKECGFHLVSRFRDTASLYYVYT